jgi:hypothetical protein
MTGGNCALQLASSVTDETRTSSPNLHDFPSIWTGGRRTVNKNPAP